MSTNKTKHLELHSWAPLDPFTREEFNDNFTRIDTAVEQCDETQNALTVQVAKCLEDTCLYKLGDATATADNQIITIDLSAIDITAYSALLLITDSHYSGIAQTNLYVNETPVLLCGNGTHSGAFTLFIPAGEKLACIVLMARAGNSNSTYFSYGDIFNVKWSAITKVFARGTYYKGTNFTLYGLKK